MLNHSLNALRAVPLLLLSLPALAQYVSTPPPQATPPMNSSATRAGEFNVSAKNGQSEQRQWADRYDCHRWATTQSGFDPTGKSAEAPAGADASLRDQYRRAFTACLEARGYSVAYGAPVATAPTPPSPSRPVREYAEPAAEIRYRPLSMRIDGGYTVATGTTNRYLDDGSNVGLGFTWFPTSALPVGYASTAVTVASGHGCVARSRRGLHIRARKCLWRRCRLATRPGAPFIPLKVVPVRGRRLVSRAGLLPPGVARVGNCVWLFPLQARPGPHPHSGGSLDE